MSSDVLRPNRNLRHPIPEVVLRTRRNVMEAAHAMRAERVRRRRHIGIVLFVVAMLVVLVTPALWNAANDLTSGEHFFDMPVMVLVLSLVLLSAIFAVLLVGWRTRRAVRDEQR